jgi:hypothetical protein
VTAKLTDQDTFTFRAAYVGDTNKHCNRNGTARTDSGSLRHDSSIGWEFDLLNVLQIYKNLNFEAGFGVVLPGKAMYYWDDNLKENVKPKAPWELATRLVYSF